MNKPHFNQIYFGGSSSGKSYFLGQKIAIDNLNGVNWLCCRNVASTMRNSVFNEVMKAISNMGLMQYYKINRSDMVITNLLNDKQIFYPHQHYGTLRKQLPLKKQLINLLL